MKWRSIVGLYHDMPVYCDEGERRRGLGEVLRFVFPTELRYYFMRLREKKESRGEGRTRGLGKKKARYGKFRRPLRNYQ